MGDIIMNTITYKQALKIYMDVLDNLIRKDLFIFDEGQNKNKIIITELGIYKNFIINNVVIKQEKITVSEVLKLLAINIDYLLNNYKLDISSNDKYAYLPYIKKTISKKYYNSYEEIDLIFKRILFLKEASEYNNDARLSYYKQIEENKLPKEFSNYTNLEIKTIEYYSLIEKELINTTKDLISNLNEENNLEYVEWNDIKDCILYNVLSKSK